MSALHATPTSPVVDLGTIAMMSAFHHHSPKLNMMDKQATQDANASKKVAYNMGRFYKTLYPPEDLAKISSIVSAAKTYYITMSMPWLDRGLRLMPTANYLPFIARFRQFKTEHKGFVDEFASKFTDVLARLPHLLGDCFDPGDYPDPDEIADCFELNVKFMPIPKGDDFRITGIASAAIEQVQQQYDIDYQAALQAAMVEPWERIADRVGKMVKGLAAYQPAYTDEHGAKHAPSGRFHTTLVTNIRELVELLPTFNLTNDSHLAAITKQMKDDLCQFDSEDLKADSFIRDAVAKSAQEILDNVSQYLN